MTSRRATLALLAAGVALPRLAFSQEGKIVNIAVLLPGDPDDDEQAARPFFEAMTRFGWVEGKNIAYDLHSGRGTRQYLETMANNAASNAPDLIFASTGGLASVIVKETDSIPVVFVTMSDPVAGGLVARLARPGRNATGAYQRPGDAADKRFAYLRQAIPELKRVGAVFDRNSADAAARRAAHEKAAKAAGLELVAAEFTNVEAIARIFAQYKRDGITVAEMTPSFALTGRRREVVNLATLNRIALFAHRSEWADAGAILTYGIDIGENFRRAAAIAHRILKGAKPAETAVELPSHLELVVNPRAALAYGIALPNALVRQAHRVVS